MSALPISDTDTKFPTIPAFQDFNDQDLILYASLTLEFVFGTMPRSCLRQISFGLDNEACTRFPAVEVPSDTKRFYL